jgi:hypothetical protein
MRAAVLTSIMDDYDTLKPVLPQVGVDVEWVCYTDSEQLRDECVHGPELHHPTGWQIVHMTRGPEMHPNRAAKLPKVHPAMFTNAPASVWLDASFRVVSSTFVRDVLAVADGSPSGIAQFAHPWRHCLYAEALASVELPKYADQLETIGRQAQAYEAAHMPRDYGLWATGVIARHHTSDVLAWGGHWAREIGTHSYQDQISHPYVCWATGLRPASLPGTHLGNQWLAYEGSGRH